MKFFKVAFFCRVNSIKKSKYCCHPHFHPPIFRRHSLKLLSPTLQTVMNWILLSPPPLSSDPDNPPKFGTCTIIQIYKQCIQPIFEYGSLSTITISDYIISKIQQLQSKFIQLALCLPKYICTKLLHDSTGLLYVKDRLLFCATKSLDRITQNPLVEESISSNRLNPAWDRFPTPLSVVRPVSPQIKVIYWGDLPKACHCLKQAVRPIHGHILAQSPDSELKSRYRLPRQFDFSDA